MTQDQPGRAQGTGYVVPGEVVPDDETEALQDEQSGPMTRLKKVASAMRGDRHDETVPDQTYATNPDTPDPNGSWPMRPDEPSAMRSPVPDDDMGDRGYADATRRDDMGAVRSPDAGSADYWDDEQGSPETVPDGGRTAADPTMTGQGPAATTAPVGSGDIDPAGYGSQADTAAGYPSQASTEASSSSNRGMTPVPGSQAGTMPGYDAEGDTATGYGTQAGTATDPQGPAGAGPASAVGTADAAAAVGTTGGSPAGRHAAGAEDAGLRPGEATDRIGDFGDIAFGNLLPDAEQYTTQWQQIQFRFVDDPQGSVTQAADVLSQVTTKLEAAIQERQRAIEERKLAIQERASALRGRWGEGSNADTETLRETLRMYRAFMDQLIGPTA
ncbi:MAG: hypothetical protein ACRDOB_08445 [Streptosporangiaceae bacterium]